MRFLKFLFVLLFLAGIAGGLYFWQLNKDQRLTIFLALLQFLGVLALIWLTILYVSATQEYVKATQTQIEEEGKEPKISILRFDYPQTNAFTVRCEIEIANPGVRATSLAIKSVQVGELFAREFHFEVEQVERTRFTVAARELANVVVKIRNFDRPIPIELGRKTRMQLIFEEVYHGTLPPVITEV